MIIFSNRRCIINDYVYDFYVKSSVIHTSAVCYLLLRFVSLFRTLSLLYYLHCNLFHNMEMIFETLLKLEQNIVASKAELRSMNDIKCLPLKFEFFLKMHGCSIISLF